MQPNLNLPFKQLNLYGKLQYIEHHTTGLAEMNEALGMKEGTSIQAKEHRAIEIAGEHNQVLLQAMNRCISVEDSYQELREATSGLGRFFPRRKDAVHNNRVEQLDQLISGTETLKRRGVLIPDNFVTAAAYAGALFFTGGLLVASVSHPYTVESTSEVPRVVMESREALREAIPPILACVGLAVGAVAGHAVGRGGISPETMRSQAEYIDTKIKKLF